MADRTEVLDAVIAGKHATTAAERIIDVHGVPVYIDARDGQAHMLSSVIGYLEQMAEAPHRRKGTSKHLELPSFIDHVNLFKQDKQTTIWADPSALTVTAIYNYHPEGGNPAKAGWRDHRAVYSCPLADEWELWVARSGNEFASEEFAELLEERLDDLTSGEGYPTPMDMLDMAKNLHIRTKGQVLRQVDPVTGQYHMINKLEHDQQSTTIHRKFLLALRIFEGGDKYMVEARIRFRIKDGRPLFSYTLHREQDLVRDAFAEVRAQVGDSTEVYVYVGTPE